MNRPNQVKVIVAIEPGECTCPDDDPPPGIPTHDELIASFMAPQLVPAERFDVLTRQPILAILGDNITDEPHTNYGVELWRIVRERTGQFVLVSKDKPDGFLLFEERLVEALTEYDADGNPLFKGTQLWGTPGGPQPMGPGFAPEPTTDPFYPDVGGIRFVYFTFLPMAAGSGDINRYGVGNEGPTSDQDSNITGLKDAFTGERPGMHITVTIDCVTVLAGVMVMVMDHGETLIKAGDTVIMNGAWHAWRNKFDQPCTVVSTLVGHPRESG
jgi:hypothetical protein